MVVQIRQGHVLERLAELPAKSVHVCVTSPPYWGLRAYGTPPQVWGGEKGCDHDWSAPYVKARRGSDHGPNAQAGNTIRAVDPQDLEQGQWCLKCRAWRGELGSEPTLDRFVAHLVEVFAAVRRVLRDDGTLWVNLGDSYVGTSGNQNGEGLDGARRGGAAGMFAAAEGTSTKRVDGLAQGNLCMAPARFALAMQAAGWTLRSQIVLPKLAPMPESVRGARVEKHPETGELVQRWGSGRPTSAYEFLFQFAKPGARYYWDDIAARDFQAWNDRGQVEADATGTRNVLNWQFWRPEPLKQAHYAAYPRAIPRLAIQAGTSERGVCPGCGAPWLRVISRGESGGYADPGYSKFDGQRNDNNRRGHGTTFSNTATARLEGVASTLGWRPSCRCPAHEPAPAVCLDPFAGSGTTLIEANALGRHGWGIELQAKYVAIAHQRLARQPLSLFAHEGAAALGVEAAGD